MRPFAKPMFGVAGLALFAPLISAPAQATAAIPEAAEHYISEFREDLRALCEGLGSFSETSDFIEAVDLNGDGTDDYIVSTRGVICDGAYSIYTGASGGEITRLVLSRDDGSFGIYEGQYRDLEIVTHEGMTMLRLGYHGSACGGAGADPCQRIAGFVEDSAYTVAWLDPNTRVSESDVARERQAFHAQRADAAPILATSTPEAAPVTGATSTYTPSFGETCTELFMHSEYGKWTCPGPNGHVVTLSDTVMRFGVTFGDEHADPDFEPVYQPSEDGIGGVIEWRMTGDGEIFATIFRAFTVRNPEDLRPRQVLVVTKIDGPQTCRVAYVDAHQADANVIARDHADRYARGFVCGQDRPLRSGDPAWFD
jgi:hypothetical protein